MTRDKEAQPNRNNGNGYRNNGAAEANEASRASHIVTGGVASIDTVREVNGTVLRCPCPVRVAMARIVGSQIAMVGMTTSDRQTDVTLTIDRGTGTTEAPANLTRAEILTIILIQIAKSESHVLVTEITGVAIEAAIALTPTMKNLPVAKTRVLENSRHARTDGWHSRENDEGQHARRSYGRNNDRLHSGRTDRGATSHVGGASNWHSNRATLTNFNDIRRGDKFMGRIVNERNIGVFVDIGMMYNGKNKHGLLRIHNMTKATRDHIEVGAVVQVKVLEKFESEGIGKCELMEV